MDTNHNNKKSNCRSRSLSLGDVSTTDNNVQMQNDNDNGSISNIQYSLKRSVSVSDDLRNLSSIARVNQEFRTDITFNSYVQIKAEYNNTL
jgi:hypothetical protein